MVTQNQNNNPSFLRWIVLLLIVMLVAVRLLLVEIVNGKDEYVIAVRILMVIAIAISIKILVSINKL